jgi:hypothetical protein
MSMLRRISKFLYPSIFKYESLFYQQREKRIEAENKNLQLIEKIEQMTRQLSLMKELSQSDDLVVLKSIDEDDNILFLSVTEEFTGMYDFINVEIHDPSKALHTQYKEHKRTGWLYAQKHRGFVKVTDFRVVNENRGIGSLMMDELCKYIDHVNMIARIAQLAVKFDNPVFVEEIRGDLKYPDWDHIDKLEYFYSNLGFEVLINHDRKEGSIRKKTVIPK